MTKHNANETEKNQKHKIANTMQITTAEKEAAPSAT